MKLYSHFCFFHLHYTQSSIFRFGWNSRHTLCVTNILHFILSVMHLLVCRDIIPTQKHFLENLAVKQTRLYTFLLGFRQYVKKSSLINVLYYNCLVYISTVLFYPNFLLSHLNIRFYHQLKFPVYLLCNNCATTL